jgi:hypothetical protein
MRVLYDPLSKECPKTYCSNFWFDYFIFFILLADHNNAKKPQWIAMRLLILNFNGAPLPFCPPKIRRNKSK